MNFIKIVALIFAIQLGAQVEGNPSSIANARTTDWEYGEMLCPPGTFVKQIRWNSQLQLRDGIEIYCHEPASLDPSAVLRNCGHSTLNDRLSCTAIRWAYIKEDNFKRGITIYPNCSSPGEDPPYDATFKGSIVWCVGKRAMVGLRYKFFSDKMNYQTLYDIHISCRDVDNIESMCKAHDKRSILLVCDASLAQYHLKCTRAKKVGYGFAESTSEQHHTERTFHEEFGFEIGYAGFGLSANFHANIGQSQTTGYDWGTTQESTFQEEVTITVEVEAPGGCITQIIEIIGECSFMEVRPNYFQRLDNCSNVVFTTNEVIPTTFLKQVYVSKIPEMVMQHLEFVNNSFSKPIIQ